MKDIRIEFDGEVLVYKRGTSWIAQSLDYDLSGSGVTRRAALDGLRDCLASAVGAAIKLGRTPFVGIAPPPEKFIEAAKKAARVARIEDIPADDTAPYAAALASKSSYAPLAA